MFCVKYKFIEWIHEYFNNKAKLKIRCAFLFQQQGYLIVT